MSSDINTQNITSPAPVTPEKEFQNPNSNCEKEVKLRRRYSLKDKIDISNSIAELQKEGISIRQACFLLNVSPRCYRDWKKKMASIVEKKRLKGNAESLHTGPKSTIAHIHEELLAYVFKCRDMGMGITTRLIRLQACKLCPEFQKKKLWAQEKCIQRFAKRFGLVYRNATHVATVDPINSHGEAEEFMEYVRPLVNGPHRHPDFIINMDQTPVWFTYDRPKTLDLIGTKTVNVRKSTNDTKRATLALTVTASGKVLTPFMVFKAVPGGSVETREVKKFPKEMKYTVQKNAWMDERAMLLWIDWVLAPVIKEAPPGVEPILILDSYRVHLMATVVARIQNLGVRIEIIPSGCTFLCQAVDVGVNKPVKDQLRNLWEEWMLSKNLQDAESIAPTRKLIATWTLQALENVSSDTIANAWKNGKYSWFP